MVKKLIKIARLDHWGKNVFILPGMILAIFFLKCEYSICIRNLVLSVLATCFTASANYIINEYLDRNFDKFHPTKKNRTLVTEDIKLRYIILDYLFFLILGLSISWMINIKIFEMEIWLLIMGILYNVYPIRTKDIPILDVLSESINNIIRLMVGWFSVTTQYLPPMSVIFGYWMIGAYLMNTKRYAEYMMIPDKNDAAKYRKSFKYYNELILLLLTIFYSIISVFFCGIFIVKYRVELVIIIPFLAAIICYYISLSYKEDSAVAKPEKLYKENKLMMFVLAIVVLGLILLNVDIPGLNVFLTDELINI